MITTSDIPLIRKTINKTFDNLEYKTDNILQNFSNYPIYLYHRTNHYKTEVNKKNKQIKSLKKKLRNYE